MIVTLLTQVDTLSKGFVMQGYQNLVQAYSAAILGLIALSVILFGYALVQGWVDLSLGEIVKRVMTTGIVVSLAMNWGTFSQTIYTFFTQVPNEISAHLLHAIPHSHFATSANGNAALEQAWNEGVRYSSAVWNLGSLSTPAAYLWGTLMLLLVLAFVGLALIDLIIAKFGLAIFLVLSSLAIPMLLFKASKEALFDGWFKHLITFGLMPIFVYCALALGLALMGDVATAIQAAVTQNTITLTAVAPYAVYSLVSIGLIVKAVGMASSLGNGFSVGAGQHVANKVGNYALRKARESLKRESSSTGRQMQAGNASSGNDNGTNATSTPTDAAEKNS